MGKVRTYVVTMITLMMFLTLLGFETGMSPIYNKLNFQYTSDTGTIKEYDLTGGDFWSYVFNEDTGVIIFSLGGAILIGLALKTNTVNILTAVFMVYIGILFGSTSIKLISMLLTAKSAMWITGIAVLIFGGLGIGFVISAVEWVKGVDN